MSARRRILLLLGRVGGPVLGVLVLQRELLPEESWTGAMRRVLLHLEAMAKSDALAVAFDAPLWIAQRGMTLAAVAEAMKRCAWVQKMRSYTAVDPVPFSRSASFHDSCGAVQLRSTPTHHTPRRIREQLFHEIEEGDIFSRCGVNCNTMIVDHEGPCYEIWTLPLFIFTGLTAILTPFEIAFVVKKDTFRTRAEAVLPLFFAAGSMVDLLAGTTHVCKKHASKAETHQYTARAPFAGSADVNFHLVLSKDTNE